jgi:hypothetical protein
MATHPPHAPQIVDNEGVAMFAADDARRLPFATAAPLIIESSLLLWFIIALAARNIF